MKASVTPDPGSTDAPARCPLCGGPSRRAFLKHGYWILDCVPCGHRFAEVAAASGHVEQIYGDAYFNGGGAGYPDYLALGPIVRSHAHAYARILTRYMAPGCVLDVGAAAGFFLQGLVDAGWRGMGIEPNPRMAEHANKELGLRVEQGCLEGFESVSAFDLVSMVQVVPHFVDPRRALTRAAAAVRPGGHWLVETWDRGSWTARFFGESWHEYSPPSVLHWFTPAGLSGLAATMGMREVARGRPRKRLSGAHVKSLLGYMLGRGRLGRGAAQALRLVPDRLAIPYPSEDLFWGLYQKV